MEPLNADYRRWTVTMWTSLRDGQVWHVPRSNTTFQRQGDALVFLGGSQREYEMVRSHFENIGVPVVPASELPAKSEGRG